MKQEGSGYIQAALIALSSAPRVSSDVQTSLQDVGPPHIPQDRCRSREMQ
jgi:hypothetical protein